MFRIPVGRKSIYYLLMLSATALILNSLLPPLAIIPFIILFLYRTFNKTLGLSTLYSFTEIILAQTIQIEVNKGYRASDGIKARGVVK